MPSLSHLPEPLTLHSPLAAALRLELEAVVSARAWATVIILCQTILDHELGARSELEEVDGLALNKWRFGPEFVWLRHRRNALVHFDEEGYRTAVDLEDRAQMEKDAARALKLLKSTLAD